ncbi:MAG: hypothetical protein ACLQK8_24865, partial [Streptosporangiaceae bacterium]
MARLRAVRAGMSGIGADLLAGPVVHVQAAARAAGAGLVEALLDHAATACQAPSQGCSGECPAGAASPARLPVSIAGGGRAWPGR